MTHRLLSASTATNVQRGRSQKDRSDGRLTRRQKRLLVLGRLAEADGMVLSDRAIARELGVSQPFVSALRRRLLTAAKARPIPRDRGATIETLPTAIRAPDRELATTAQEALDRFLAYRQLSGTRPKPPESPRALIDWDWYA
jgi:hypothetical protein